MIEQTWPDTPEDPPYELPDDHDWPLGPPALFWWSAMKTAFSAHSAMVEAYEKLWKTLPEFHVHVDFPSGEDACWGTHPKTKILKNGRKMPLVERGTGPRVDPFAKGGKGRYERKANLDPAR